jgi:N-acetylmuramoyl-L-alanine amidase
MALKTSFNYSPNFNLIKRKPGDVKFIIFHYTGMKNESAAINRLTNIQCEVSSHYFIKISGEIITIVPDLYTAWHAGRSTWKNYNSLNKNSIGIEIANSGHGKGYKKFSRSQILSLIKLSKFLIKKYKISSKNILGHSDVAPDRKKDPGEKFPWKYLSQKHIGYWHNLDQKILVNNRMLKTNNLQKKIFFKNLFKIGYSQKIPQKSNLDKIKYLKTVTKAFQRRFRQELINGIIDQECLIISKNLTEILK